jgi:hypothetical protein
MIGRGKRARSTVPCWSTLSEGSQSSCFQTGGRRLSKPGCLPTGKLKSLAATRVGEYAAAAKKGAPQAQQIADKFHLLLNLREKLKELMARTQKLLPHVEIITSRAGADKAQGVPSACASAAASSVVEEAKSFRHMSPYPRATPSGSVPIPVLATYEIRRENR